MEKRLMDPVSRTNLVALKGMIKGVTQEAKNLKSYAAKKKLKGEELQKIVMRRKALGHFSHDLLTLYAYLRGETYQSLNGKLMPEVHFTTYWAEKLINLARPLSTSYVYFATGHWTNYIKLEDFKRWAVNGEKVMKTRHELAEEIKRIKKLAKEREAAKVKDDNA